MAFATKSEAVDVTAKIARFVSAAAYDGSDYSGAIFFGRIRGSERALADALDSVEQLETLETIKPLCQLLMA